MSNQKRHHWWPRLQSQHWCDDHGHLYAVKSDGSSFKANPINIGVESELYTAYSEDGLRDLSYENWFSTQIENPFVDLLTRLKCLPDVRREAPLPNPEKQRQFKELGFVAGKFNEFILISPEDRNVLSSYICALLVRSPRYIAKIKSHHQDGQIDGQQNGEQLLQNISLANMIEIFKSYQHVVSRSDFLIIRRASDNEFLFSDAGIVAQEPWRDGIPFDIHVPLTPDISIEVLPVPRRQSGDKVYICMANNQGVARMNRIVLGNANRFVFSRKSPPIDFIKKNFGVPAPLAYGIQRIGDRVQVRYDASRDRPL